MIKKLCDLIDMTPHIPVHTPAQIGTVLRLVRKLQGVRSDDLAGTAGVGHVFVIDLEKGKSTVQLGKVLQVLDESGIRVYLEVPEYFLNRAVGTELIGRDLASAFESAMARSAPSDWMQSLKKLLLCHRNTPGSEF